MSRLDGLVSRNRETLRRLVAFGLVGVVSTVFDLVVFNLLLLYDPVPRFVATSLGYAVGLVVNYLLNRSITFRGGGRERRGEELAIFVIISVVGLGLNNVAVELVARTVSDSNVLLTLARLVAAGVIWSLKFVLVARWVFPSQKPSPAGPSPAPEAERDL